MGRRICNETAYSTEDILALFEGFSRLMSLRVKYYSPTEGAEGPLGGKLYVKLQRNTTTGVRVLGLIRPSMLYSEPLHAIASVRDGDSYVPQAMVVQIALRMGRLAHRTGANEGFLGYHVKSIGEAVEKKGLTLQYSSRGPSSRELARRRRSFDLEGALLKAERKKKELLKSIQVREAGIEREEKALAHLRDNLVKTEEALHVAEQAFFAAQEAA